MRRIAISVALSTMTLSLAGCGVLNATGDSASASPTKGDDVTVGLLLPEKANSRYDKFDYPIIKNKVAELTRKQGKVEYANADASAARQAEQLQGMIDSKVDVILLDAVDARAIADGVKKAKDAGIPVIAYDRLAEGPIDAYISFDNELVGEVQGRTLLDALGSGVDTSDKIVMMNGSPTDPNAKQFKEGALSELNGKVTIAESYDTTGWKPEIAEEHMAEAIAKIGKNNIAGVYSANDGMAGGIIKALEAAGVTQLPPITGQDAELDAVQRVVAGEQYMSVYKSYPDEAEAAAQMAVTKIQGKDIQFDALTQDRVDSPTLKDIPAKLVQVSALTKKTVKDTVVADGIYSVDDICTAKYKAACAAIGLK
ncbi:substrate-binding domain-containing protein [Streptomyces sp. SID486]|uniref:sugar ABC transporter substrate-binding protein n=1 Tax=unclassified Streptomyces TaxID=2593676 RepID=UPI001367E81D|nr:MULTISPECIES: substrate-binding domain-containing protein [unclassified Streptomyces]MYW14770.1 substrate-binding domain-containing protein [Streptomyces sp. SID2955]MYW42829.1 substrate-binding domain-containing protein [Streptomyces sp. SID161]MYX94096.1 substrate-binding domain-containing protein [Streptomyces sp. SID486]